MSNRGVVKQMVTKLEVEKYYARVTKLDPRRAPQRIAKILAFANNRKLTIKQIRIVVNQDLSWKYRQNRTVKESKAERVGYTNTRSGGYVQSVVWVMER